MTCEQYVWWLFVVFNLVLLVIYIKLDALFAWGIVVLLNFGASHLRYI